MKKSCNQVPPMMAALGLLALTAFATPAANLWWDGGTTNIPATGDGASSFLAGTWNLTTSNWDQGAGLNHVAWTNANLDNAIFGGTNYTAGTKTITLGTNIVVNQLVISTGTNISGGGNYTVGAAATPTLSFGGSYSDSAPAIDTSAGTMSPTISARITGTIAGGLVVKDGNNITTPGTSGRLYLTSTATNDFVGDITLLGGNLHVLSSLGNAANKIYLKGGALFGSAAAAINYIVARDIIVSSDSAIGLNSTVANINMELATNKTITGSANLTRYNSGVATGEVRLFGDMSGYTGTFTNAAGTLVIQTAATSGGAWVLTGGTVKLNTAGNDSSIANGVGRPDLVVNGGALNLNGKSETINGLSGSGGFVQNDLSATNAVLTLGDGDATAAFGGTIRNNSTGTGTLTVAKIGNGTQTLTGTNTATGGYLVTAGTLQIGDGVSADSPFTSLITNNATLLLNPAAACTNASLIAGTGQVLKAGSVALELTGTNTYSGATLVQSGKLTLNTTKTGSGAVYVGSFAELEIKRQAAGAAITAASASSDNSTLTFNFNAKGINATAPLNVTGAFTNNGNTTVNIVNPGSLALASYPLIKYGTYVSNAFSSLNLTPISSKVQAHLANNPGNSSIDLVVDSVATLTWTGAQGGNWDFFTPNWVLNPGALVTNFSSGDLVRFDDSATGSTLVTNLGSVDPTTWVVTNSTKNYTFGGGGTYGGVATLTKQGSGTLTLAQGPFTYSGGTLIQGGTLQLGDGANDPALPGDVQDNGTLAFNVASTQSLGGVISGSGSVNKSGAGKLTLGGNNTYSGVTTIANGRVDISNSGALGTAAGGTTVSSGAELHLAAAVTSAEPLSLVGSGTGAGALVVDSGASVWNGNITAAGDTLLGATASGSSLTIQGAINAGASAVGFQPVAGAVFTASSNVTAGSILLGGAGTGAGCLVLGAADQSVTNVSVLTPYPTSGLPPFNAGLWARDSSALGTNSAVVLLNTNSVGNSGTMLRIGNGVSIPAAVSLTAYCPGTGAAGVGDYRVTFGGDTAPTTNAWNGPITIHGADIGTGTNGIFMVRTDAGLLRFNSNIVADGVLRFLFRGAGATHDVNGSVTLAGSSFMEVISDAGTTVVNFNATGNSWSELRIAGARVNVGVGNALPVGSPVLINNASGRLDLNGFNQLVGGLYSTAAGTVVNGSTNTDSTLKIQSAVSSNWVFTGTIANVPGAKALNLDVAGSDPLTLTSSGNSYAGSTTIRSGTTLFLTGSGNITASTPINVQAGGTFDVSARTDGTFTLTTNRALMGNGTINGSVSNALGSLLSPGASVGTLTVTSNLLIAGDLFFEVNKALSPSNDVLSVGGAITNFGAGTLTVSNLNNGLPLAGGNKFTLFNHPVVGGSALTIAGGLGSGLAWTNLLAVDGSIQVVQTVATNPTNITFVVNGSTLTLSWPPDHQGWFLQTQTNSRSVGLNNNWFDVPGSDTLTSTNIIIDKVTPTIFFRLRSP
jgi:autotransporter-associated beta strand protein